MGEIIPFSVWIIPYPVVKVGNICKRDFLIGGQETTSTGGSLGGWLD